MESCSFILPCKSGFVLTPAWYPIYKERLVFLSKYCGRTCDQCNGAWQDSSDNWSSRIVWCKFKKNRQRMQGVLLSMWRSSSNVWSWERTVGLRETSESDMVEKVCFWPPDQYEEVDKMLLKHSRITLDPIMLVLIGTLIFVGRALLWEASYLGGFWE